MYKSLLTPSLNIYIYIYIYINFLKINMLKINFMHKRWLYCIIKSA
ncbi:hypothetical protein ACMBCM_09660 [Spiroplasma sp. K1]